MTLPQAISLDELKEEGCIYFAHIQEGFDRYAYKMLTGTGEYLRTKLLELIWRSLGGKTLLWTSITGD